MFFFHMLLDLLSTRHEKLKKKKNKKKNKRQVANAFKSAETTDLLSNKLSLK